MNSTKDLKTFAENDFDSKQWINRAWNTSGSHEKEVFVANTVARLQLYMKQLSNSLDETTTQIVASVPRILQDASTLQVESSLLQQKLFALEQQVQGVQQETGHSIESLQRIDQLKSRLENAASALREADKWAALVSSLEDMLDSSVPTQPDKLRELAEQVTAMTASLEVLVDAPDYDKKRVQLETLYNRLEAAISPPLIEALTQMDAERTSPYVSVLRGMSRGVSACRCWRRAAAARAAPAWRRHAAAAPPLAPHHHQQLEWLTNVLQADTPLAELVALYTDLLLSFDPTPTKVVTAKFKLCQSAEEGVNLLLDVRAEIDEFVRGVRSVVDAPKTSKETVPPNTLREFGRAAYAPLRALLPEYTELQTQLFLAHLQHVQLEQEGLLEYSRTILSVTERCEGWFAAAYEKAKTIAGQAAYTYYAPAAEAFIAAILSLVSTHTRRIEAAFNESEAQGGGGGGVLSETFPAALVLQEAAAALLPVMQRLATAAHDASETTLHPLDDMASLLHEGRPLIANEEASWGAGARHAVEQLRTLARNILRAPPHRHLDTIPQLNVWCNNDALSTDLPDFALSPQEYITEIGQYLMTLPQHLEMHLSEKQAPWQFLNDVCTHTCEVYAEKILNIRNMDALGTKRCLTDIVYLSSVVEDLGSSITPALKNLEKSLRAAITTTQNE